MLTYEAKQGVTLYLFGGDWRGIVVENAYS